MNKTLPNTHTLKSWPQFFEKIITGNKTHELRRSDDRFFQVGDYLHLKEYDEKVDKYTGREALVEITYITRRDSPCAYSDKALDYNFCILSIKFIK